MVSTTITNTNITNDQLLTIKTIKNEFTVVNPALCVPSVWCACTRSFGILNLTQAVRMDLYAKMEMLAWICDIYR